MLATDLQGDMPSRLILFELNEVPRRVLDDFCAARPHSALARLRERSVTATTETPDKGHLSPWITWPTLHRGVANEQHGLTSFGQPLAEIDARFPPVWQILARSGIDVGVFGSLHSYPIPAERGHYAFYVPDTFAAGPECLPPELTEFQAFNLAMVAKSARNVSTAIPEQTWSFLRHAFSLGITPTTFGKIAAQLASEKVSPWRRIRRRTFQATVGFDVFFNQLERKRPRFSTFFTNHVASAMHRYWAATFPQEFPNSEYDDAWRARYGGEIGWAMGEADSYLERLLEHCDRVGDTALMVASSMGQAAAHGGKRVVSQLYLVEPEKLMDALGVARDRWQRRPAMLPQFNCVVEEADADAFEARLRDLRVAGRPVEHVRQPNGFFSISFGQENLGSGTAAAIGGESRSLDALGLRIVAIEDEAGSSGYHIPQGILIYYDPARRAARRLPRAVSTLSIAPAICDFFGAPAPAYMTRDAELQACIA